MRVRFKEWRQSRRCLRLFARLGAKVITDSTPALRKLPFYCWDLGLGKQHLSVESFLPEFEKL